MSQTPVLVSVAELAERILPEADPQSGTVRLLDVRWRLGDPAGHAQYLDRHIPGAVYADLDTDLAAPAGEGTGRHPLPDVADLQAAARRWGINAGDTVVAYDDNGNLAAARAWWLLRWAGVADVRLLDGGLAAWRAAGHPLATGEEKPEQGDVTLTAGALPSTDPDGVARLVTDGGVLLDARATDRYRGEPNPYDPRPGHIPGAVSAPTSDNLTDGGTFRDPAELAERFAALGITPGRPVGVYCGSGVTAAHQIAALSLAGIDDVVLYPGSWSQWAALPDRPAVTGADPYPPAPLVDAAEAGRRVTDGAVLIDVRSAPRRATDGTVPGAIIADRKRIAAEFGLDSPERHAPIVSLDTPIVVVCGSIVGSGPVAAELQARGFTNVVHVDGGFTAWAEAGLPTVAPEN
ncbi:rhodanese-like domain-containing protein [Dactylosporangium sp. NPDC050588]|uniref:rhodanese-like domain-containing protein n=1 Tax=Dactylosporangium sp. NPDC050588 TaxID=3157211 RepID=UPI0033F4D288